MREQLGQNEMTGLFAFSKAGHDRGTVYIIIKEETEYVYLADGSLKSFEKPKRKNKKHIQVIKKHTEESLRQRLLAGERLRDEEIRHAIKQYLNGERI